ncbi:MAG TPA: hypothetical protein VLH16_02115 [Bacteroidales bacterium]|nr:hypothetical protein [Bacteroidales bacterium]
MTERERKLGLTFSQILSLIGVSAIVLAAWISLNVKIAENTVRIEALEKGRIENSNRIQQLYQDNRSDHSEVMQRLDKLIYDLKGYD